MSRYFSANALNEYRRRPRDDPSRLRQIKPKDIEIALDVTEGILAAIYVHADAAKKVSERVPARPKKTWCF